MSKSEIITHLHHIADKASAMRSPSKIGYDHGEQELAGLLSHLANLVIVLIEHLEAKP